MNIISKAISELKFTIPIEILDLVFVKKAYSFRALPLNLDEEILNKVVRPRVLVDANLVGGTEIVIPLEGVPRELLEQYIGVYQIPKSLTGNQTITSVKAILYLNPYAGSSLGSVGGCQYSPTAANVQSVLDAMLPIPQMSTADISIIGENTIMVKDARIIPPNAYLRCMVTHDEEMSTISPRSYLAFAKLVGLAVKSYIWVNRVIPMDKGELHGGFTLGAIKEVISEYRDSEEMYQDYLRTVWTKVAFQNNKEMMTRHNRLLIGGPR